jgi:HK97 family phage portal protein
MTLLDTVRKALIPATPVIEAHLVEEPAAKATVGTMGNIYERGGWRPLDAGRTDTARFMKKAQQISHTARWVTAAERVISGKFATVGWHLEDIEGQEITENGGTELADFRRLIERPNPRMTRRVLWQITSRHLGVCGNAFWFLDQRNLSTGAPLSIYYINPARMTPVADKAGILTGWALDAETDYAWGQGVPLELDEVLHFVFEPPDWGHLGHGLVEAALSVLDIQRYADRFAAGTFATGGKRGGIAGPKEGILPDDVYQSLQANFRAIAESPDSERRTIVTSGAVDYTATSSTPDELELVEMLTLARDDTLALWGVPLSQLGTMAARGLNSGETVKYEEAALWQNAIHTRVVAVWEVLQYQLIDRINPDWQFVIEEPTFDDQEPLYKLADLAKTQPLSQLERRKLVGLGPIGDDENDPRNAEVWLPKGFTRIYPEPEEETEPAPVPPSLVPSPSGLADDQAEAEDDAEETTRKASVSPLAALRAEIDKTATPDIKGAVTRFLAKARDEAVRFARHRARKTKDGSKALGRTWDAELSAAIMPKERAIAAEVAGEVRKVVPKAAKADPFEEDAIDYVRTRGGERITGINATTRDAVLEAVDDALEEAIADGLGPDEAADLLSDRVGSLAIWDEARADLIARTETMFAYNDAALTSYRGLEVGQVVALDGDKDPECADRNGRTFSIDDAFSIADHPNGTLDWAPVV